MSTRALENKYLIINKCLCVYYVCHIVFQFLKIYVQHACTQHGSKGLSYTACALVAKKRSVCVNMCIFECLCD